MNNDNIITNVRITPYPQSFSDPIPEIYVKYWENDNEEFLFSFYHNEISFSEEDLIWKTKEEALELKHTKDKNYLQS